MTGIEQSYLSCYLIYPAVIFVIK